MRVCQVCLHNGKRVILNDYDGQAMCLFECTGCGHRYIDALKLNQAWFDDYYLTRYTTDDKPYSDARLKSLAEFIDGLGVTSILDVGGMDGELSQRLLDLGIVCSPLGVGGEYEGTFGAVVLSHTLEHIYNLDTFMDWLIPASNILVVEIPIHLVYNDPVVYDYHWQHINKFRPVDIERLFERKGYKVSISKQIEDYREYQVWRIVGRK